MVCLTYGHGSLWAMEVDDQLQELQSSCCSTQELIRRQKEEITSLKRQLADLDAQLLEIKRVLSQHGILPPMPEEPEPSDLPPDTPAVFPARTEDMIVCPWCGRRQKGNRNACYACGLPFQYETE